MQAQTTPPPDPQTALVDAVRQGATSVEVACPDTDCHHPLLLIDRVAEQLGAGVTDRPSTYVALADPVEPEHDLAGCPGCLELLAVDVVVLRDRHGRCAQALADEHADDRADRARSLDAALRRGDIVTAAELLKAA